MHHQLSIGSTHFPHCNLLVHMKDGVEIELTVTLKQGMMSPPPPGEVVAITVADLNAVNPDEVVKYRWMCLFKEANYDAGTYAFEIVEVVRGLVNHA